MSYIILLTNPFVACLAACRGVIDFLFFTLYYLNENITALDFLPPYVNMKQDEGGKNYFIDIA